MDTTAEFLERCNALMQGQDPVTVLRRALEIIREPEQWTPRSRALDANNNPVRPEDPNAVCWCIEGAIALACNNFGILPPYFMLVLDQTSMEYGCDGVNLLESALDHAGVVEFLERVIERVQG
jgi:hypothetical protein